LPDIFFSVLKVVSEVMYSQASLVCLRCHERKHWLQKFIRKNGVTVLHVRPQVMHNPLNGVISVRGDVSSRDSDELLVVVRAFVKTHFLEQICGEEGY